MNTRADYLRTLNFRAATPLRNPPPRHHSVRQQSDETRMPGRAG